MLWEDLEIREKEEDPLGTYTRNLSMMRMSMNHHMKLVTNLEDFKGEALEVEWSAFRKRSSLLLCEMKDLMGLRILGR